MFLRRLELQGFKSFAAKTVIDFPDGITAIVGPNGSGKSNVADAVRWLLGEREAKNLRGVKADDLIFAGTEKRARSGMAQASIYFDNSSGFFPAEYNEVVISRRIDRDGNSKFFLNRSEIKLRDIIDFFARSRLGARGLNIISQGESDIFLRANPVERRLLMEEVLGLKEYLLKKNSSERKLRNTGVNLDKARAMLEEMKPHLKMLRRQVGRYVERDKISAELSELENAYYGAKARSIAEDLLRFEPDIASIEKKIAFKKEQLSALKNELKKVESSEPETKKKLDEIRIRRRELFNEKITSVPRPIAAIKPVKGKRDPIAVIKEIKNIALSAANSALAGELKEALFKIISLVENIEENKADAAKKENKNSADREFADKMAEFNKLLDELDFIERKLTAELDEYNSVFRAALIEVEAKKDEISNLEDEKEKVLFEKEKIKYRESELENQLRAVGRTFAEFASVSFSENDFNPLSVERKIFRLRNELASIGEVDESIIRESEEAEKRFSFLTEQIDELEKASADLKSLIKELDYKIHREFSDALSKINGELSDFAKMMFGGGKISLKLADPAEKTADVSNGAEEILQEEDIRQGIEIDVSFPKKRIKGLEVLSGGERSLLAIAILFGLISISPPPFVVLDEVDAALDERNARRFGEILDKFGEKTQFIVVTHNRATMESAKALYGVTMNDDGCSKLISLKLS